jgi:tetratricopeptide (TPR) repeat protein
LIKHKTLIQNQAVPTNNKVFIENKINEGVINSTNLSAIMTGIVLQTQADTTFLRFLLNNNVLYRINADVEKNILVIVLEHTKLLTSLPSINYANSSIQHISMTNEENGDLKIIIKLEEGALLQHLSFSETSKLPEFQIDINRQNLFIPAKKMEAQDIASPTVKKVVVDMGVEQEYQRALNLASTGEVYQAIEILTPFVKKNPTYNPARQTLVTLLLQENEQAKAEKIVDMGLIMQPSYLAFVELKARILVEKNKVPEALALLGRISPPIVEHPDYYAFLAALYQRQGQAKFAAKLYEQLLTLYPNKGAWWVGLAIAFDSLGKHADAKEAYARADNQSLNPELKAYVETELRET